MATELPFSNVITLIITVLVIAIVVGGGYYIFVQKTADLTKVDFQSLPSSTKTAIQANSEQFIENLNKCVENAKDKCRCVNTTIIFPKEVSIEITNKGATGAEFDFLYNKKSYFKASVSKVFISHVYNDGKKIFEHKVKPSYTLTFDKFPKFGGQKIISRDMYKIYSTRVAFITYNSEILGPFGSSEQDQINFLSKVAAC